MPKYIILREQVEAAAKTGRVEGQGGNLDLDYRLPVRHVLMTAAFAFWGSPLMWAAGILVVILLAFLPLRLTLRLWPVILLPLPFGLVPAFRAAEAEWQQFTGLVKQSRWAQEVALGRDLDGDGVVGRPPIIMKGKPPAPTRAQLIRQQNDEFRAWILSLDTGGTAFRGQVGLSREDYEERRDKLMELGWAEWKKPGATTLGWRLTAPAAEVAAAVEDEECGEWGECATGAESHSTHSKGGRGSA